MGTIFISYRRADSAAMADRIYAALADEFGRRHVFKDVDTIPGGQDFRTVLTDWMAKTDVLLVLVGENWLSLTDEQGQRRIDAADDFVHYEVELGLRLSKVTVIPVILGGAQPPSIADLPESLRDLAYLNAVFVRDDPDFEQDMARLTHTLRGYMTTRSSVILWSTIAGVLLALIVFAVFLLATRDQPTPLATSCKAILANNPAAVDGIYTIHPAGAESEALEVSCDMSTAGGGWTLLARSNLQRPDDETGFAVASVWTEIYKNFEFNADDEDMRFRINDSAPRGYLDSDFFAMIEALGTVPFQDTMIWDGKQTIVQTILEPSAPRSDVAITLQSIYNNEDGVFPLHTPEQANSGFILLLGKDSQTGEFPCYYPARKADRCENFFAGDNGANTAAFYVAALAFCDNQGAVAGTLWGSKDCYENDRSGGFAGFRLYRAFNAAENRALGNGNIQRGFIGGDTGPGDGNWAVYIR